MMSAQSLLAQVLAPTLVVFLFAVSLLGLALGLALVLGRPGVFSFIGFMNRWVSTRQALKPLEAPVRVAPVGGARWFGAILLAIGAYAVVTLLVSFDVQRLAALFKVDPHYSAAALALEALKWLLVLGSAGAVVAGAMLLFFPQAWRAVEERANRWYSTRNLELAGDTVYLSLERMVEAHPRAAGGVILVLSLLSAVTSGLLLLPRR
jgi:hypothetical protein